MLALHHGLMYQPPRQVNEATCAKHPFVSAGLETHLTVEDVKGLIFVIMDMRRRPLTRREATRH
jgi:hypothetical protein